MDAHVGLHIFNECIGPNGILGKQKATRILVTHQVHFLKNVDWLIIMRAGQIVAQGPPQELSIDDFDPSTFHDLDERKQEDSETQRRRKMSRISTKSLSAASLCSDYDIDIRRESEFDAGLVESLQMFEESASEQSQGSTFKEYFLNGANRCVLFIILLLFIFAQATASGADYWVSFW